MQYLVVSILGADQAHTANELCKLAAHYGCRIINCRFAVLGGEFAAIAQFEGTWNAIAKFEGGLPVFEQKQDVRCLARRTQLRAPQPDQLPYSIYIVAPDHEQTGTAHKVTQFFADQAISIGEFYINTYKAPVTEAPMLAISLSITVPAAKLVADLRESFMLFCDDHNLDAIMEPQKN